MSSITREALDAIVADMDAETVTSIHRAIENAMQSDADRTSQDKFEGAMDALCEAAAASGLVWGETTETFMDGE